MQKMTCSFTQKLSLTIIAGKSKTLNLRLNSFVKKFPKSPYLDNSIYLAGKLALEEKNYPEALQHFQRIITQYPLSNKVISAKFGKGNGLQKNEFKSSS